MAQVTPNEILQISAGMEAIYKETVDDLLINIAHHFNITGWERTRFWEIKKLSELGALTEESVAIIAKHTQRAPEEIRAEFLEVAQKACKDLDPQLKKAAAEGILQDPATDVTTSPAMRAMLTEYEAQAIDKLNMVNTTMLESTRAAFVNTVQDITRTEAQLAEAQGILNAEAGAAATHVKTHTQATQSALKKLSQTGITGFVDRAGRNWTPEAYVAMDIRTTAHNVAVNSVRTREQEYGTDLFQVSAHPAARPLCYPWQNKILSWGASGGTFTDGDGRKRTYQSINETSYGQPAGLFGINCTHFPLVVIPGMTVPHDMPEQDPEENAKAYAESQQQRAIERDIRAAKRDLEIAKAAGLPTEDADKRVKDAQAHMRQFIKDTGRTRQYSREKIGPTAARTGQPQQQGNTGNTYRTFRNVDDVDAFFGKRPEFELRRTNREQYKAELEAYRNSTVGKWTDNLSTEELGAVGRYSGDAYSGVNGLLRGQMTEKMVQAWDATDDMSVKSIIKNLDSAIERFELPEPIRVYRTCENDVLENLQLTVGSKFRDDGYASSSVFDKKVASGNIVMQINVPAGTGNGAYINELSGAQDEEYEFLIARGSEYEVKSIQHNGEDTIVELNMIGHSAGNINYASKEDVIEWWKRLGIYDEYNASRI